MSSLMALTDSVDQEVMAMFTRLEGALDTPYHDSAVKGALALLPLFRIDDANLSR